MSDLMRDPKSGRMLSRLETEAKQAAQAAEGFGLPKESQQLLGLQSAVGDDSPAVQSYVQQLVQLVRDFRGPVSELKKVLPLLKEVSSFAEKDKTLSAAEKRRIEGVVKELTNLITKKTSLFTRSTTAFKSVARKGVSTFRDSLAESNANSGSALVRLGAKMLGRRESGESEQKNILQTRADILGNIVGRKQQEKQSTPKIRGTKSGSGRPMSAKDFAKEPEFDKPESPKKRQAKEDKDDQSALLTHILDTERDVLTELKNLTKTLRGQTDDMHEERDEQARRDERQLESLGKLSPTKVGGKGKAGIENVKPVGKPDKKGGFMEMFGEMVGFGELAELVTGTLIPTLTAVGVGALAIGAAWAGWKVGSWVAQLVGLGDSSKALSDLLDSSQESYADSLKAMGKGISEGFNRRGFGETEEQKAAKEAEAAKRKMTQNSAPMSTSVQLDPNALGRVPDRLNVDKTPSFASVTAGASSSNLSPKTPSFASVTAGASTSVPNDAPKTPSFASVTAGASTTPTKQPFSVKGTPTGPAGTSPKKVEQMNVSPEGLAFIQEHEGGFQAKPYQDNDGAWTVGYGSHTFKGKSVNQWMKENPKFKITQAEADEDMRNRLDKEFLPALRRSLSRPVSQPEFDALASMAWNRGVGGKDKRGKMKLGAFERDTEFLSKVNDGSVSAGDFAGTHGNLTPDVQKAIEQRRAEEYGIYSGHQSPTPRRASASTHRNAAPITTMSASNRAASNIVIVPQIVSNTQKSGGGVVMPPMAIRPKNAESTFRAIQTINEM